MDDDVTVEPADLSGAFKLVGELLYHFAILEREIDLAMGKLLGIAGGPLDIVASNTDFMRKVKVLWSTEGFLAAQPDIDRKKLLKQTWSSITQLNDDRKMAAHALFERIGDSVVFRHVATGKGLTVDTVEWSPTDVQAKVQHIQRTIDNLQVILRDMKPYAASMDFSDRRNSGLVPLL
ncbi:hypothetical protein NKJ55_28890 [Mesorhizobium sp. M0106]|uniref:hypothetical protein n=1 Tax=Mesorhizobium sp. M0106 TaxID=2956880 RepID=UPI00333ADA12